MEFRKVRRTGLKQDPGLYIGSNGGDMVKVNGKKSKIRVKENLEKMVMCTDNEV